LKQNWREQSMNYPGRLALLLSVLIVPTAAQPDAAARLKADLLSNNSATVVLGRWCADKHLAAPPTIKALRDPTEVPASAETRALLKADTDEPIRYRRVKLMCGTHVLSEADNWYVPARLTPQMNALLEGGDTPFGTAVKALHFHRTTLEAAALQDKHTILRVRALLLTPDEMPFSLVVENYTADLAAP
jgi:chorismate-pyruvate lyase